MKKQEIINQKIMIRRIVVLYIVICFLHNCSNIPSNNFIYSKNVNNIKENTKIRLDDSIIIGMAYDFSIVKGNLVSKYRLYRNYENKNYKFCLKDGFSDIYINASQQNKKLQDSIFIDYCDKDLFNEWKSHIDVDSLYLKIYKELKIKNINSDIDLDSLRIKIETSNINDKDSLVAELVKKIILKAKLEIDKNIK